MPNKSYSAYCLERAAECRRRADRGVTRDVKAAYLDMEQMWLAASKMEWPAPELRQDSDSGPG
jgi:hypothetical protein